MAALAASDVTYTVQSQDITEAGLRELVVKVEFGDGSLTYPAGGVPLTKASLGCPNVVKQLVLLDQEDGNGYVYKYDFENLKLRIYQGDNDAVADGPLVELGAGAAPAATDLYVAVKGW